MFSTINFSFVHNMTKNYLFYKNHLRMKPFSFLISLSLLILFPSAAGAQSHIDAKRVKLGVFVSPALSWMHPTTKKSSDNNFRTQGNGSKMGFTYGLMLDY